MRFTRPVRRALRSALSAAAVAAIAAALGAAAARPLAAQVRPDLHWRTLGTEHFRVHFTPELEALARRTAADAEIAWARLSEELAPPRGIVDIVVADNVDYANGYATPWPSNRIVVYARPPVEDMPLRAHENWNRLLVTHELTHIFHLDRVRGFWAGAQRVFGRAYPFFPATYSPSWVLEGMAVHYETRFGGGGRLAGTEFPAYVRAQALHGELPALDALSLASPRWPGGDIAYIYGSYAVTRADSARMGRFVEAQAARLIPWRLDADSREAFGVTFSRRWDEWRDSVQRAEQGIRYAVEASETMTLHGFVARFPRFTADGAIVYVADDAKRVTGAFELGLDGDRRPLGRRNSIDANAPDRRSTVQGELDRTDPYSVHGDLYRGSGLRRRRLTRGERLSAPDVHEASGRIVAVKTEPGTTSIVLVDGVEGHVDRDIARGTLDRTWAEPRLSRSGEKVAAVRWERGGRSSVVVMDLEGKVERTFAPRSQGERAPRLSVVSSPAWEPGDTTLLFVSDHEGRAVIYRGDVRTGAYGRVWNTATALNTPDVSRDGKRMVAVELRADGYHVVVRERPLDTSLELPAVDTMPDPLRPTTPARTDTAARAGQYKVLDQLYPTWWLPVIRNTDPGTLSLGLMSSNSDVVGRHSWDLETSYEGSRSEWTTYASYAYAGFAVPVLYLDGSNEWIHGEVFDTAGNRLGIIGQRTRRISASAVFERPRTRLSTYLVLGAEHEATDYRTYPGVLLEGLGNEDLQRIIVTGNLTATAGFSTMQHARNGVSVQDGLAGYATVRERLGYGIQYGDATEIITSLTGAWSLPLPGYSRHVLAARAAYGVTDHTTTAAFAVGGVSGSSLDLLPGVGIGAGRRTWGVRGFNGGTQLGVRALGGTVEYRAPLFLVGRGYKLLPVFLQKSSLTFFADAASAWCEFPVANSFICPSPLPPRQTIASVGTELALDAAIQYDAPYRFRLGWALPVRGEQLAPRDMTLYFTLGSSF